MCVRSYIVTVIAATMQFNYNPVTMLFLILMVAGMSYAAKPELPGFKNILVALDTVDGYLRQNVLSMAGNIPYLDDYRRHYAEIHHVLYDLADSQSHCFIQPYDLQYQVIVNDSAPVVISRPAEAIDRTQNLMQKLADKTQKMKYQIRTTCKILVTTRICDLMMLDRMKKNKELAAEGKLLIAGGKFATRYESMHEEFLRISKQFHAHNYLITGKDKLKSLVMDFAEVLRGLSKKRC